MLPWSRIARLPEKTLAHLDPIEVSLACAADLPGVGDVPTIVAQCRSRVDAFAERVRWETVKQIDLFRRRPHAYHHHEGYFRTLALVTTLQQSCGLRYDPAKIPEEARFEVADSFVHGALLGAGGTCATIPVVVVAVGRRLGYPLRLVAAKGGRYNHLFARWQDAGGHFNIEATAEGLRCPADDYYRQGRYAITSEAERRGRFLWSMTPREELASYLVERFHCWKDAGNHRRAVEAIAWASGLSPANDFFRQTLRQAMNEWWQALQARMPAGFPQITVEGGMRRFPPVLPAELERDILGMEAAENILNNRAHERDWWGPLRHGITPLRLPVEALAFFEEDGCRIRLRFVADLWGTRSAGFAI